MLSICPILEGKVLHLKQTCFPSTQDCLVQSLVETGTIVLGEKGFQCCQFIFTFFLSSKPGDKRPTGLNHHLIILQNHQILQEIKHQEFNYYVTNLNIIIK